MQARIALAGALAFTLALGLVAAVPLSSPRGDATATATPPHSAPALASAGPPEAGVGRGTRVRPRVGPLRIPLAGESLPADAVLLPEATRDYRSGIHEGIDFPARAGTAVLAAAAGRVVRADTEFSDWTANERAAAFQEALEVGHTPERTLDRIRGRQIWIDHGKGVVTRYVHLESVAVAVGDHVGTGAVIGTVGSSGYPEGGPHLHFEIRIGDSYLGNGLTPAELARALRDAFP